MAFKGGYQIIDLMGKELTLGSGSIIIPGIYEKIEGQGNKAILLCGLNIDGVEQDEAHFWFRVSGTDFTATAGGITVTVNEDDEVTIEQASSGGRHVSNVQIAGDKQSATFQQNGAETVVVSTKIEWSEESDEGETEVKTKYVQVPVSLGVAGHASATIGFNAYPDPTTVYVGLMVVSVEPVLSGSTATGVSMSVSGVSKNVDEDLIYFGKPSFATYEIIDVN